MGQLTRTRGQPCLPPTFEPTFIPTSGDNLPMTAGDAAESSQNKEYALIPLPDAPATGPNVAPPSINDPCASKATIRVASMIPSGALGLLMAAGVHLNYEDYASSMSCYTEASLIMHEKISKDMHCILLLI
jgi:hypothetical protein